MEYSDIRYEVAGRALFMRIDRPQRPAASRGEIPEPLRPAFKRARDSGTASESARSGRAGPEAGPFDAGFGSADLARILGKKRAREGREAFAEKRSPDFDRFRGGSGS